MFALRSENARLRRDRARLHSAIKGLIEIFSNEYVSPKFYDRWDEAKRCVKEIRP